MLITDLMSIGNKLYETRRRMGLTQSEVAEAADIADRTYANIERGTANIKVETFLRICNALQVTPDEILTEDNPSLAARQAELIQRLNACKPKDKETALQLLTVFLQSLE